MRAKTANVCCLPAGGAFMLFLLLVFQAAYAQGTQQRFEKTAPPAAPESHLYPCQAYPHGRSSPHDARAEDVIACFPGEWLGRQVTVPERLWEQGQPVAFFLMEEISQSWSTTLEDWVNSLRNLFHYDERGNRIESRFQRWEHGQWSDYLRYLYTYDAQGKQTEQLTQDWDGTDWVNTTRSVSTYDASGREVEKLTEEWNGTRWVNVYFYTYRYDEQGNEVEGVRQEWNQGRWTNRSRYLYTFDTQGNETEYVVQTWEASRWTALNRTLYTYDEEGAMTEYLFQHWRNNDWQNSNLYHFIYDAQGLQTETRQWYWNTGTEEWRDTGWSLFSYDARGNQIKAVYKDWQPDTEEWFDSRIDYDTYDDHDNCVEQWYEYRAFSDEWFMGSRSLYTYNYAPSAEADEATTAEDTPVVIDVLANDSDPDDDDLTLSIAVQPAHGTVSVETAEAAGPTLTYVPEVDFFGQDSFAYRLKDSRGASAEATVTVTIEPVNDAPTAPQITSPADGAEIMVGGAPGELPADPSEEIVVEWTPSEDVEGDEVSYRWELASAEHFAASSLLLVVEAGARTQVRETLGAIAAVLDAAGVVLGEKIALFHRLVASDGRAETTGAVAAVTLVRGTLVGVEDKAPGVPVAYALEANYPNPFNPRSVIRYDLPEEADVRLTVYDALGREVAVLAEGPQTAGRYEVTFEGSVLPSGLYLYRLEASSFTQTRCMVLVR